MYRYLCLSFCLASLVAIAPAAHAEAPSSGGPLLTVGVSSTTIHPGDYVSVSVSSVASWNGTRTNYSQGPLRIDAVTSGGGNYSPLAGLHALVNGSFGINWQVLEPPAACGVSGEPPIDYIALTVTDLQTGLVRRATIDVEPSWSQAADMVNRTLTCVAAALQGVNGQQNADEWLLVYVLSGLLAVMGVGTTLAVENHVRHRAGRCPHCGEYVPVRESTWDRVKGWVRISREPIPDAIDLAFTDREHVYGDLPLKLQLDVLGHREEYLNEIRAWLRSVEREIAQLPKTRSEVEDRFRKNRREHGLDPDWEA